MTDAEITQREAEIKARIDAVSQSEWKIDCDCFDTFRIYGLDGTIMCLDNQAEAELIANSLSDLIWLMDRIASLKVSIQNIFLNGTRRAECFKERIEVLEKENAQLGHELETALWDNATELDVNEVQQERIKELETELLELKLSGGREYDVAVIATKQLSAACSRHRIASKWAKRWKLLAKRTSAHLLFTENVKLRNRIKELEVEVNETEVARVDNWNWAVAESKCTSRAHKWAKRWKRLAKRTTDREEAFRQMVHEESQRQLDIKSSFAAENLKLLQRIAVFENAARSCTTCLHYVPEHLEPVPGYCNTNCRKPDIRYAGWVLDEERYRREQNGK